MSLFKFCNTYFKILVEISKENLPALLQNKFVWLMHAPGANYMEAAILGHTTWGSVTTCSTNGMVQGEQGMCQIWYKRFLNQYWLFWQHNDPDNLVYHIWYIWFYRVNPLKPGLWKTSQKIPFYCNLNTLLGPKTKSKKVFFKKHLFICFSNCIIYDTWGRNKSVLTSSCYCTCTVEMCTCTVAVYVSCVHVQ